ncbi:MAG: hypothetical protein ACRBBP_08920 [Bdellovibrionales bacterium]
MKYIVLIVALFSTSFAFAEVCGDIEVFQVQETLDDAFVDKYKSEYAYAHIFCRERQCYRAYDLTVEDTGGDPDTGRVQKSLTTIKCTSDRSAGFWERMGSPITSSFLNTYFNSMKSKPPEAGGLPLLDIVVTPLSDPETQSSIEPQTPSAID